MLRVGYRVRLSSGKGPDREGVVTALVGSMLRVRWSSQEETIVSPGPGTLTVLASSSDHPPSTVTPSGRAGAPRRPRRRRPAPKKAAPRKAAAKAAPRKAAPRKAAPRKAGRRRRREKAAPRKAEPRKARGEEGCAEEDCGDEARLVEHENHDWEDDVGQEEVADQDRCQEGDGQEWQRDADGRESPGSLISAARPATSPTIGSTDREQDDGIGPRWRQGDAFNAPCHRRSDVVRCASPASDAARPTGAEAIPIAESGAGVIGSRSMADEHRSIVWC